MMSSMGKANSFGSMVIIMQVNFFKERDQGREYFNTQMEICILVTGLIINNMGKANSLGLMVIVMKADIKEERDQEKES